VRLAVGEGSVVGEDVTSGIGLEVGGSGVDVTGEDGGTAAPQAVRKTRVMQANAYFITRTIS